MLVKILESNKAKIKLVTYNENKIFLSVLEGGRGNPIPLVLLETTLRNLGVSLGIRIDYLITKANSEKGNDYKLNVFKTLPTQNTAVHTIKKLYIILTLLLLD